MHGSAAGCVTELLGPEAAGVVEEIRSERDPLFGGHPPEPLAPYLGALIAAVKASTPPELLRGTGVRRRW